MPFIISAPATLLAPVALRAPAPRWHHQAPDAATAQAKAWLAQSVELGKAEPDERKVKLFADAAVVAHQCGDQAGARAYLAQAKALTKPENALPLIAAMARAGEGARALAYQTEVGNTDSNVLRFIGSCMADDRDPGAKAVLLTAQAGAAKEENEVKRAFNLIKFVLPFKTINARPEIKAALDSAEAALDTSTNPLFGGSTIAFYVIVAGTRREEGDTAGAKAALAKAVKRTDTAPYVDAELAKLYYRIAAEAKAEGDTTQATTLRTKAAALLANKISGDGDEAKLLVAALGMQARAGDVDAAIARANKGEFNTAPVQALFGIASDIDTTTPQGKADSHKVLMASFAAADAVTGDAPDKAIGAKFLRLNEVLDVMVEQGDNTGALVVAKKMEALIPQTPAGQHKYFYSALVSSIAPSDYTYAATLVPKMDDFQRTAYLNLAQAAAQVVYDRTHKR